MNDEFDFERLEKALREEEPYIPNEGFSARVLTTLPRHRRLSYRARRKLMKALSAAAGLAVALPILSGAGFLPPIATLSTQLIPLISLSILLPLAIAVACLWIASDRA